MRSQGQLPQSIVLVGAVNEPLLDGGGPKYGVKIYRDKSDWIQRERFIFVLIVSVRARMVGTRERYRGVRGGLLGVGSGDGGGRWSGGIRQRNDGAVRVGGKKTSRLKLNQVW
jgi:hypothetical protein